MQYIKVRFASAGVAYQEIEYGTVLRYLTETGTELFTDPPVGDECEVIDASPAILDWMNV